MIPKHCTLDYVLQVTAQTITLVVRVIPLRLSIFIARSLGALAFYCLRRKRDTAYKNVKIAFAHCSPPQINRIVKKAFMNSAQHVIEIAYIPWMDRRYRERCIELESLEKLLPLLSDKKGAILLGLHEGSWEISCVALGHLLREYNFTVLARPQKDIPLLYVLLEEYRAQHHCGIVHIKDNLRPLVEHLKKGYALGLVADHGAQGGIFVDFFGRPALTPTGAVKLALKLDTHVFIGFMKRKGGPAHTITFSPYQVIKTGDFDTDVKVNLEQINRIYEHYIRESPEEYLWFFKRWKHSRQRNVLILNDGKAGHLKQSLAVADCMRQLPFEVHTEIIQMRFRSRLSRTVLEVATLLMRTPFYEAVRRFLYRAVTIDDIQKLSARCYDLVISCGSSLAALNSLIAFEHRAKSVVIMKPGILSMKRFDLVIVPEHDRVALRRNVVITTGAVSRVVSGDDGSLHKLIKEYRLDAATVARPVLGLAVGGDSRYLRLEPTTIKKIVNVLKQFVERTGGTLVVTTSRRTSAAVAQCIRQGLHDCAQCKMLIIANENNPDGALETLLYTSDILIISGDSISMISEALGYGKHIFVFPLTRKRLFHVNKHERFIQRLEHDGYLRVVNETQLNDAIIDTWHKKPAVKTVPDNRRIIDALAKIV